MGTHDPAVLQRLLDIALALGGVRRTEAVLQTILDAARELTGAGYAAIGVPDGDGGFALFLTAGVDAQTWAAIGSLPRTHGVLGAMLGDPTPFRCTDIRADPRFRGWPGAHPEMTAFLGVPIVAGGEIVAALYLANTGTAAEFGAADQELVEVLAAHAALAVVNAQRHERVRELSVAEERARMARDLHDSVTQTLFSLSLSAETAAAVAPSGDPRLAGQLNRIRELAGTAKEELRALVDTLRPPDLARQGLATALRRRIELLRRVHDVPIDLDLRPAGPVSPVLAAELFKLASEALSNALQHATATRVAVSLHRDGERLRLAVHDDGTGFDLAGTLRRGRRLGLASMRERAEALGGTLHIDTEPGRGTEVVVEVPDG
ncbi:hypothetical protein BH20ACT5_BH20ACT5_25280 [soil metagenome]